MKILIDDFEIDIHGASKGGGFAEMLGILSAMPQFGELLNTISRVIETDAAAAERATGIIDADYIPEQPAPAKHPPYPRKKPGKRPIKKR